MPTLLLLLSIILSTGRNLLSKNLSGVAFGTRSFFDRQSILFAFGALALLLFGSPQIKIPSPETVLFSIIYGILLILAQWFYTISLGGGSTALCSTVYSLGFILPALSGALIWSEPFSVFDTFGILCAILAILFSRSNNEKNANTDKKYFIPLIVAMLASGGLGIMQKIQQKSDAKDEKSIFLIIAFLLAALISYALSLFVKAEIENTESKKTKNKSLLVAIGIGIAFGCCNLLNTALAGLLPSTVFFPTLNIGVILATMLCSIFLFKERLGRKEIFVLMFGGMSIFLLNIG